MSILNVHDIDRNVDENILMRTLEGRQEVLKNEFERFLEQFRGLPINEHTIGSIKWEFKGFMEHVTCKFAFNCQLRNVQINKLGTIPTITGDFEYTLPQSITYTTLKFSIA